MLKMSGDVAARICAACLLSSAMAQEPPAPSEFAESPRAEFVRVISGNTLVLVLDEAEIRVELEGVARSAEARERRVCERFLDNLLKGEQVFVQLEERDRSTDKSTRRLGLIRRAPDGLFVNLEVIRQGYGRAIDDEDFAQVKLFHFYELRAREAHKGVWGPRLASDVRAVAPKPPAPKTDEPSGSTIVYITKSGTHYHAAGCPYLRTSSRKISLSEADKRFKPCSRCKPPELKKSTKLKKPTESNKPTESKKP